MNRPGFLQKTALLFLSLPFLGSTLSATGKPEGTLLWTELVDYGRSLPSSYKISSGNLTGGGNESLPTAPETRGVLAVRHCPIHN